MESEKFNIVSLKRGQESYTIRIAQSIMDDLNDYAFIKNLISTIQGLNLTGDQMMTVFPRILETGNREICMWCSDNKHDGKNPQKSSSANAGLPTSEDQDLRSPIKKKSRSSLVEQTLQSGEVNDLSHSFQNLSPFKGSCTSNAGLPSGECVDLDQELTSPSKEKGTSFVDEHTPPSHDANMIIYANNIPKGCQPKDITEQITLHMHIQGLATLPGSPVTNVSLVGRNSKIEIRSIEGAKNALKLQGIFLKDQPVRLDQEMTSSAARVSKEGNGSSVRGSTCLESDEAIEALLHALIYRRKEVMSGRISQRTMSAIISELQEQGFQFNSNFISTKKRNMLKYYRDKKRVGDDSWRFYDLVAQLVDDMEFDGTFAEIKTLNRVLFDQEATLELINQYGSRKELFDRARNKRELREEVCVEILSKHPHLQLTWQACERKWASPTLRTTYYDFTNDANVSGSDGVTMAWTYYDPMHVVLHHSLGARPMYTFAVGARKEVRDKSRMDEAGDKEKGGIEEAGKKEADATAVKNDGTKRKSGETKKSMSNVARKLDLEERKLETQNKLLGLFARQLEESSKRRSRECGDS